MTRPTPTFSLYSRARLTLEVSRRTLTADFEEHTHDHTELFIVLNGSAVHSVGSRQFFIKAGDVYVLPAGVTHAFSRVHHLAHYNIGFYPELVRALGDEVRGLEGFQRLFVLGPGSDMRSRLQLSIVDLRTAEDLADGMRREYESRRQGFAVVARAQFVELAVFLSRRYAEQPAADVDGLLRLARAASHVERHFREPISVAELAHLAGVSPSHFARLFKKHYRVSPLAHVLALRVQEAAHLLASSDCSVTRAALASGFSDGNYFARQFRRLMGVSPRQYRAASATADEPHVRRLY